MNRRSLTVGGTVAGVAATVLLGTVAPAFAYWTLTSHPESTGGAGAGTLAAPVIQVDRTGQGNTIKVHFRVVPTPGQLPTTFSVSRQGNSGGYAPLAGCTNVPVDQTCTSTDSENNGNQHYRVFATAGTFWKSSDSICDFQNSQNVLTPTSVNCSVFTSTPAPVAPRMAAPTPSPTPEPTPTPTPEPTPTPTPTPTPEPSPEAPPAPVVEPEPPVAAPAEDSVPATEAEVNPEDLPTAD